MYGVKQFDQLGIDVEAFVLLLLLLLLLPLLRCAAAEDDNNVVAGDGQLYDLTSPMFTNVNGIEWQVRPRQQ